MDNGDTIGTLFNEDGNIRDKIYPIYQSGFWDVKRAKKKRREIIGLAPMFDWEPIVEELRPDGSQAGPNGSTAHGGNETAHHLIRAHVKYTI